MPRRRSTIHALLAGLAFVAGLVGSAVLMGTPAQAQLVVEPEVLSVPVAQSEEMRR